MKRKRTVPQCVDLRLDGEVHIWGELDIRTGAALMYARNHAVDQRTGCPIELHALVRHGPDGEEERTERRTPRDTEPCPPPPERPRLALVRAAGEPPGDDAEEDNASEDPEPR